MEGLIRGLLDVALGHEHKDEESESQSREERSRSTWAQVVSGEHDGEEEGSSRTHDYDRPQWNREDYMHGNNESLEFEGSRPSRLPQQVMFYILFGSSLQSLSCFARMIHLYSSDRKVASGKIEIESLQNIRDFESD